MDWGLLMAITQAGCEQDREDREAMRAEMDGQARARPVSGETRLSAAVKRKQKRKS